VELGGAQRFTGRERCQENGSCRSEEEPGGWRNSRRLCASWTADWHGPDRGARPGRGMMAPAVALIRGARAAWARIAGGSCGLNDGGERRHKTRQQGEHGDGLPGGCASKCGALPHACCVNPLLPRPSDLYVVQHIIQNENRTTEILHDPLQTKLDFRLPRMRGRRESKPAGTLSAVPNKNRELSGRGRRPALFAGPAIGTGAQRPGRKLEGLLNHGEAEVRQANSSHFGSGSDRPGLWARVRKANALQDRTGRCRLPDRCRAMVFPGSPATRGQVCGRVGGKQCRTDQREAEYKKQQDCRRAPHRAHCTTKARDLPVDQYQWVAMLSGRRW